MWPCDFLSVIKSEPFYCSTNSLMCPLVFGPATPNLIQGFIFSPPDYCNASYKVSPFFIFTDGSFLWNAKQRRQQTTIGSRSSCDLKTSLVLHCLTGGKATILGPEHDDDIPRSFWSTLRNLSHLVCHHLTHPNCSTTTSLSWHWTLY